MSQAVISYHSSCRTQNSLKKTEAKSSQFWWKPTEYFWNLFRMFPYLSHMSSWVFLFYEKHASVTLVHVFCMCVFAGKSRRLQSVLPNCTPPAIEQFPRDIFSPEQRRNGFLAVHVLTAAYMFLALAIACDDYFVPSLEAICDSKSICYCCLGYRPATRVTL